MFIAPEPPTEDGLLKGQAANCVYLDEDQRIHFNAFEVSRILYTRFWTQDHTNQAQVMTETRP